MLMDFVLNPELVHEIMKRVASFYVEHFRKILSASKGDEHRRFPLKQTRPNMGLNQSAVLVIKGWC